MRPEASPLSRTPPCDSSDATVSGNCYEVRLLLSHLALPYERVVEQPGRVTMAGGPPGPRRSGGNTPGKPGTARTAG